MSVRESLTRRSRVSSPRISLCSACLERSLWSGNGLEAPGTVLGRVGRKGPLGSTAENEILFGTLQISLGTRLEMLLSADGSFDADGHPGTGIYMI
jgi:hypothetical protein